MRHLPVRPTLAAVAVAAALTACGGSSDDQLVDPSPDPTEATGPRATPSPITEVAEAPVTP